MSDIAISLIIAGIGALLAWAIAYVARRLRARQLRKKYPVAGRFLTEFEDREGDEPVMQKALTTIRQEGRRIEGETTEIEAGRSWNLSGTIERGGFIHGLYGAEDPHDTGTGTFFLKINGTSGDLEGLWAGYDSVNGEIAGGRYVFRRCPVITIRPAQPAEIRRICSVLGEALGEQYIDVDGIAKTVSDDDPDSACFVAVTGQGQIVGALTVFVLDREGVTSFLPVGQEPLASRLRVLRYNEQVGLIGSVTVKPDVRGRGVATELTRRGLQWSGDAGATAALSFGWKSKAGCHIAGVMTTLGFSTVREVPNFWTEDSRQLEYECPECGGVCECVAVVFTRSLDGSGLGVPSHVA